MSKRQSPNVAASVRQRLLNRARAEGEDFQVLLTRYVLERWLYRLSRSSYHDRFVVKGAMLFLLWEGQFHRMTRDLDLLSFGSSEIKQVEQPVRDICAIEVEQDDGIVFRLETVRGSLIRADQIYEGVRVTVEAYLGSARIPLQIDIGFGDAITPAPQKADFPVLLDFPAPLLHVYPRETVIAEKLQAMVALGIANSRMKDFYDLWYLSRQFAFEGPVLVRAISATFERRATPLPTSLPLALTDAFASDARKQTQWKAFLRKGRLQTEEIPLKNVIHTLHRFLEPLLSAAATQALFDAKWQPAGPWQHET